MQDDGFQRLAVPEGSTAHVYGGRGYIKGSQPCRNFDGFQTGFLKYIGTDDGYRFGNGKALQCRTTGESIGVERHQFTQEGDGGELRAVLEGVRGDIIRAAESYDTGRKHDRLNCSSLEHVSAKLRQLRVFLKGDGSKILAVRECIVAECRDRSRNNNGSNGRVSERVVSDLCHRRRKDNGLDLGVVERVRFNLCRALRKNDLRNTAHTVECVSAKDDTLRDVQNAFETAGKRDDPGNAAGNLYQRADVNAVLGVAVLYLEGSKTAAAGKDIFVDGGGSLRDGDALQSGIEERIRGDGGERCGQGHGFERFGSAEGTLADLGNLVEGDSLQCAVIAEGVVWNLRDAVRKSDGGQRLAALKHAGSQRHCLRSGCKVDRSQLFATVECVAVNLGGSLRDGHRLNCRILECVGSDDEVAGGVDGHLAERLAIQEAGVTDGRYRCRDVDGFQCLAFKDAGTDEFQFALELYARQALAVIELLAAAAYRGGIAGSAAELGKACRQNNRFQSAVGEAALTDLYHLRFLAEADTLEIGAVAEALDTDLCYRIRNIDGLQRSASLEHLLCQESGLGAESHALQIDTILEQSIGRIHVRRFHRCKGGHAIRESDALNAGSLEGGRADVGQLGAFLKDNRLQRNAVFKIVVAECGNGLRNRKGFNQRAICDQGRTEGLDQRSLLKGEGDERLVVGERVVSDGGHRLRNLDRREALVLERDISDGLESRGAVRFFLKGQGSNRPFVFFGFKRIVCNRLNRCGN